ncbi:hypothetical protein, partial [Paracoccus sp. AS002]|uniref:hypothetical protein n=1 Tax=Paracoccus sp. AS002 TaxID=3019545 RepID=UPI0023E803C3
MAGDGIAFSGPRPKARQGDGTRSGRGPPASLPSPERPLRFCAPGRSLSSLHLYHEVFCVDLFTWPDVEGLDQAGS